MVDPFGVRASVASARTLSAAGPAESALVQRTPYLHALVRYSAPPYLRHNHGATRAERPVDGMFLTVDVDPSVRPMDLEVFVHLSKLPQARARRLDITWVNHSYTHPYRPGVPQDRNFLLTPGVRFDDEVLNNEVALLQHGLTPSPFFRFPGLVASEALIRNLRAMSLIPIGSDAWLAKGRRREVAALFWCTRMETSPSGSSCSCNLCASGRM